MCAASAPADPLKETQKNFIVTKFHGLTSEPHLAESPARSMVARLVGYPSGQRGQTVNLLAYAFDGSNPSPTTILCYFLKINGLRHFNVL
jgi:hypothetical protein